jgi:hypothetical protein
MLQAKLTMLLNPIKLLLTKALPKFVEELTQDQSTQKKSQAQVTDKTMTEDHASVLSSINPTQVSRLGEILLRQRLISEAELNAILEEQKETNYRLGELLLKKFLVTEDQLQQALKNRRVLLGELLIRKKLISQELLQDFLVSQGRTQQYLGQLLVQSDWLSEAQLNSVLREQYWRRNGYWVID